MTAAGPVTAPGNRLRRTRRRRLLRRGVGTAVVALLIGAGWTLEGWWTSPSAARDAGTIATPATSRTGAPTGKANAPGLSRPAGLGDLTGVLGRAPTALSIPAIGVSSGVVGVGTDARTGELEVPADGHTTVWWADGARPGDATGTTVLAAHVDWAGQPGVFFHLASIPIGAVVTVRGQDGDTLRYRVTARRHVAKPALAGEDIFRLDGAPRLILVTCGGAFDSTTRSYEDNVVVEALPIA